MDRSRSMIAVEQDSHRDLPHALLKYGRFPRLAQCDWRDSPFRADSSARVWVHLAYITVRLLGSVEPTATFNSVRVGVGRAGVANRIALSLRPGCQIQFSVFPFSFFLFFLCVRISRIPLSTEKLHGHSSIFAKSQSSNSRGERK